MHYITKYKGYSPTTNQPTMYNLLFTYQTEIVTYTFSFFFIFWVAGQFQTATTFDEFDNPAIVPDIVGATEDEPIQVQDDKTEEILVSDEPDLPIEGDDPEISETLNSEIEISDIPIEDYILSESELEELEYLETFDPAKLEEFPEPEKKADILTAVKDAYSKRELKELCKVHSLGVSGNMTALTQRLIDADIPFSKL